MDSGLSTLRGSGGDYDSEPEAKCKAGEGENGVKEEGEEMKVEGDEEKEEEKEEEEEETTEEAEKEVEEEEKENRGVNDTEDSMTGDNSEVDVSHTYVRACRHNLKFVMTFRLNTVHCYRPQIAVLLRNCNLFC